MVASKFPSFLSPLRGVSTENSITITANISNVGSLYCAAFIGNNSFVALLPTQSLIRSQGFTINAFSSGISQLTIQNLQPQTSYGVFCFTSDFNGNQMNIDTYLPYSITIQTQCCLSILFVTPNFSVFQPIKSISVGSLNSQNLISFKINSKPVKTLRIKVFIEFQFNSVDCVYKNDNNSLPQLPTITPNIFSFDSFSIELSSNILISGYPGCYKLNIADTDNLFKSNVLILSILSESTPLPPPKVASAIFSDDGLQILLLFDSQTDKGATTVTNFDSSFDCSILLIFTGGRYSKCQWTSSQQLRIILGSNIPLSELVNIGDTISVKPNMIKGICGQSNCLYAFNPSYLQVILSPPSNPINPQPSLSAPTIVGQCDKIVLDPTNSYGSGSRPWKQFFWSVKSLDWSTNSTEYLQSYLNLMYPDSNQLVYIPPSYLSIGTITVSLTLTNFLTKSSLSSATINVITSMNSPIVTILGPKSLYKFRWQPISLVSSVSYSSCRHSNSSISSLYNWKVYSSSEIIASVTSKSLDQRSFKLDPYSLNADSVYSVVLTVTNKMVSTSFGTATSNIIIGQSGVVATISGGTYQTISLYSTLSLDASLSYDIDYPLSKNLTYYWSCVEISPSYGSSCEIYQATLLSAKYNSIVNLIGNISDSSKFVSKSLNLSVQVANSLGMTSATYVIVNVVNVKNSLLPVVKIIDVAKKYNVNSKIIVSGIVTNPSFATNLNGFWTISNVNISLIALTPTQLTVLPNNSILFQLAMKPLSLYSGMSYQLRLSAQISTNPTDSAYAEISIVMNSPPYSGVLQVTPSRGYELNTSFSFLTSQWITSADNLPLQYLFTYYDSKITEQSSIKPVDEIQYVSSTLSRGLAVRNFTINCVVFVSDYYGSQSNATKTVQVFPIQNVFKILSLMNSLINTAQSNGDTSSVVQLISTVANSLSISNCSSAPDCKKLYRSDCKLVANTCGNCLAGYIGVYGDSNVPCGDPIRVLKTGDSCLADTDCASGSCSTSKCIDSVKKCPNGCSNLGLCKSYSNSNIAVTNCVNGDQSCSVKCACNDGYYGMDCSYSNNTFNARKLAVQYLCDTLASTAGKEDLTTDVIITRSISVARLLSDVTLISTSTLIKCGMFLVETLNSNPLLSSDDNVIDTAIAAYNSILNQGSNIPSFLFTNVSDSLSKLIIGRQSKTVVGEASTNIYSNSLSISSAVQLPGSPQKFYGSPQSTYDSLNSKPQTGVSLNLVNGRRRLIARNQISSAIGIGLTQYLTNPTGEDTLYSKVKVETTFFGSIIKFQTEVYLNVVEPIYYNLNNQTEIIDIQCPPKLLAINVSINCNNGLNYSVTCPGGLPQSSKIQVTCPLNKKVPVCTSQKGSIFLRDDNCIPTVISPFRISCKCSNDLNDLTYISSYAVHAKEYSASILQVSYPFSEQLTIIPSVQNISKITLTYTILITTCVMIGLTILTFYILYRKDIDMKKNPKYENNSIEGLTIYSFFNLVLPDEFNSTKSFFNFLLINHDFIFTSAKNISRFHKCSFGIFKVISYLLVDTIIVVNFFNDTKTCQSHSNEQSCLSPVFLNNRMCNWDSSSNDCTFRGSNVTFSSIIVLLALVSIIVIVIDKISRFFISQAFLIVNNLREKAIVCDDQPNKSTDEWNSLQTKQGSLYRAAAYKRISDRVNYFFPVTERDVMMRTCSPMLDHKYDSSSSIKNFFMSLKFRAYNIGDPYSSSDLIQHPKASNLILHQLKLSRNKALKISNTLNSIRDRNNKDVYLVQQFIVEYMTSYRKQIASNIVNHPYNISNIRYYGFLGLLLVPSYLILSLIYIFYVSNSIGLLSSNLWLSTLLIAIGQDIIWLQPFRIFMKNIFIPSLARREFLAIYHTLSLRTRSILLFKKVEMINNAKSLIQHFNAACRVSLMYPAMTSSRLLMSLSDYDLPIKHLVLDDVTSIKGNWTHFKSFMNLVSIPFVIFHFVSITVLSSCPDWIQTVLLEATSVVLLDGVLIGLYFSYQYSSALFGVLIAIIAISIAIFALKIYTPNDSIYFKLVNTASKVNKVNIKPKDSIAIDIFNVSPSPKSKPKPFLSLYDRQLSNHVLAAVSNDDEKNNEIFNQQPSALEFSRVKKMLSQQNLNNLLITDDRMGSSYDNIPSGEKGRMKKSQIRSKIKSKALKYLANQKINVELFTAENHNENKVNNDYIINNTLSLMSNLDDDIIDSPISPSNHNKLQNIESMSPTGSIDSKFVQKVLLPPITFDGPKLNNIKSIDHKKKKKDKRKLKKEELKVNDIQIIDINNYLPSPTSPGSRNLDEYWDKKI